MDPITRFAGDPVPWESHRQWGCHRKVTYASRKQARRHRRHPGMRTYRCRWCAAVHLMGRKEGETEWTGT
jgi:hypothetical protein